MDYSTVAIIVSVVAVGATLGIGLASLIVPSLRDLRRDVADLRERMARLEGLFEGFARRGSTGTEATP